MSSVKSDSRNNFLLAIWIIVASIPLTVIGPIVYLLSFLLAKLYSKFIAYLAYLTDPHKGAMLIGAGAAQIRDFDVMYKQPRNAEVACLRMKGPLDLDRVVEAFHRRVIIKLDESKPYPALHYPELQQYFTKFLGYIFLKTDHKFDVSNHFTFYDKQPRSTPVNRRALMTIWEEMMTKPFVENRSAWEFVIIDNYIPDRDEIDTWNRANDSSINSSEEKYWVAFLRMHHGLGDGFSIQKMLSFLADDVYSPKFSTKITPFQRFLIKTRTIFRGTYDFLDHFHRGREQYHGLHLPLLKQCGQYYIVESPLISTKQVKLIKEKFQVPFTTVLVAAISGGIRNYLVKYDIPIPKYLSAGIPFATLEHSDKLRNEFLLATVEYAVNLSDPEERVEYVQEKMKLLETTSWLNVLQLVTEFLGTLPISAFEYLGKKQIFSSTYSTQPGPASCLTSFGATVLEVNYTYGLGADSLTYAISTLTYNGHFRMVLFIERNAVESREAAEYIIQSISEEFNVLEKYPSNSASGC